MAEVNGDSDHLAAEGSFNNTMVEEGCTLLRRMEICVAEAEKRSGKNAVNMQETFTMYLIETRQSLCGTSCLQTTWTQTLWSAAGSGWRTFCFVWLLIQSSQMTRSFTTSSLRYMVQLREHGWKEVVYETGFQAKVDSRLRGLSATFRVKNTDKRFMDMKHYSDELQSHASQLLRARARVADRLYGVFKVHGNYGRVFSEWSAIEKEMGDGLQSAGHHMDTYAASIDDILEEEEHYADQLKEYLFYAEALRAVCRKHELTQFELEMASQDLISKKQQREELATGIVRTFSLKGMTNKLFGQEAPEQREARLKLLEELIAEGEDTVKEKTVECEEHVERAWVDMQRFEEQKDKDLREALINYAVMQISMCKKGIQAWSNAKECFLKM
ncbi:sorting nexin-4-like isoform X2 [Xiphias gladius]|uniref:sorting nexin-4-like isoform X2 n=1 Tax=Xiphias gladius TaxID=8245 RepID=UPI001A995EBC|nr:sorting nexin-4-like isoform X2 [Xiphias gladius]